MKNLKTEKKRCFGNEPGKEYYAKYHDEEWGIPVHDDNRLFEMLILEGAQAGLSWETVLKKRGGYRKVFHGFIPERVALMSDAELEAARAAPEIIRNRLKIYSVRRNAIVFLKIREEFGTFDRYLWKFVDEKPIVDRKRSLQDLPCQTAESVALSKDLKKRGMTFVGPTIMYAYMQAVGLVDDHLIDCPSIRK